MGDRIVGSNDARRRTYILRAGRFETLPEGVAAARAAGVGFVIGIDRHGRATLEQAGADVVVPDLGDLLEPDYRY